VITTVGTSLIANYRQAAGSGALPTPDELLRYLRETKPRRTSAETNSLSRLKLDPKNDYLYFLCSDTEQGRMCGQAFKRFYEEQGYYFTALLQLEGLSEDHQRFGEKGLIHLINHLADLIEQYERRVVINATGGYKAEIAYATLMGLLYRVEVHYIHEDFAGMVRLPLLPLSFDLSQWEEERARLQAVLNEEEPEKAKKLVKRLPEELKPLVEKTPGRSGYTLSPAGRAVERAFDFETRKRAAGRIPLRVAKAHSTLWGDRVRFVDDVQDDQVRRLLKRIALHAPMVRGLALGAMDPHRSVDTYLEFRAKQDGVLIYRINTLEGSEALRVECLPGMENRLLDRLGGRIYP
jgi:putative CRISPR-associated protein (TIGR02619 family)